MRLKIAQGPPVDDDIYVPTELAPVNMLDRNTKAVISWHLHLLDCDVDVCLGLLVLVDDGLFEALPEQGPVPPISTPELHNHRCLEGGLR